MTNYEWLKRRILQEVDTTVRMAEFLAGGMSLSELDDEISQIYCHPKKNGCADPDNFESEGYAWKCDKCALKWLGEEHDEQKKSSD